MNTTKGQLKAAPEFKYEGALVKSRTALAVVRLVYNFTGLVGPVSLEAGADML
ncbi:hypothetical protein [Aquamicrobium soli]|uniref:Uncharacterized protein n=1 Tax=Aquamicrobium soli TaxID=1811518 RepID=A0ABV7K2N0_9HYPH